MRFSDSVRNRMNKKPGPPRFTSVGSNPSSVLHNFKSNHYIHAMTPIRILAPSLLALLLASCGNQKADSYDTPATPDASAVNAPTAPPSNPVYDTPAAYEESTGAPASANPNISVAPAAPSAAAAAAAATAPAVPKAPSNGAAIIHTVVAGDTLSGISAKYKVPAAAIRQANNMTKDTVVLGRKMVIPPVN